MSLNLPSKRLLRSASSVAGQQPQLIQAALLPALVPAFQSLSLAPSGVQSRRGIKSKADAPDNPLEASLRKQSSRQALLERFSQANLGTSIFSEEVEAAKEQSAAEEKRDGRGTSSAAQANKTRAGGSRDPLHLARAVDPDPRSRVRWERKMVIAAVRNSTTPWAKEPKASLLRRTERTLRSKSPYLPTSLKKLVHLARQIQGKTVAEALEQMRFSKKKMAREVAVQLREARNLAIVERGMGLGGPTGETERWRANLLNGAGDGSSSWSAGETGVMGESSLPVVESKNGEKGVKIQTKDGRWMVVDDPTTLYIDQAWVGKGPWRAKMPEYRARGRMNILKRPSTSISVALKEEKTRIREYQERQTKKARREPWVHLPNRPVTAQRQYYSW